MKVFARMPHVYRNRTNACLVVCRCHDAGQAPECEPAEQAITQAKKRKHGSISSFCSSTRAHLRADQAVL